MEARPGLRVRVLDSATLEPVRGVVRVTEDECHVRTVEVVAEMRAAESS